MKNTILKANWADLKHILRFITRRFSQDRCAQMAASLTFTTLLSLVPLLTIALTLFSAFPVFDDFYTQIKNFVLANMMPGTGGRMISRYTEQFAESAAKLTAVGITFLALTAMLMMLTIDHAFNTIWRVSRPRPLVQRILIYWAVLTLAPLLVGGSLSLTSWLVGMSAGYARQIPALGVVLLKIMPVILTTAAFSLLFRIVPNRFVPLRHAIIGGVAAALVFEFMNRGFAAYILYFPTYKLVYGTFASIPIFLLWVYLSWLTVLLGALITASLSHWRSGTPEQLSPAAQFYFALRVLEMMTWGMRNGTVQTLPLLSRRLRIGFDSLEQILEKLAQVNVVRKLGGNAWVMVREAQHIKLAELYRVLIFDPSQLDRLHYQAPEIRAKLEHIAQAGIAEAGTLLELLNDTAEPNKINA
jgi:membrane protein